jgi:hypothetical protein
MIYQVWTHVLDMVNDYRNYTQEDFELQKRYLTNEVDFNLVKAISIRFCNGRIADNMNAVYHKVYSRIREILTDFSNEAEISEELEESIEIVDTFDFEEIVSNWVVEPMLLCLETEEELQQETFCAICLENYKKLEIVTTNCNHEFCNGCMCNHLDYQCSKENPTCPMCRTTVKTLEIKDADFYDNLYERYVKNRQVIYAPIHPMPDPDGITDIDNLDSFELFPEGIF